MVLFDMLLIVGVVGFNRFFLFPDDGCGLETEIPFQTLAGESTLYVSLHQGGAHFIVLTNYRLFFTDKTGFCSIPHGLIDVIEQQNDCSIVLLCKDCRSIK